MNVRELTIEVTCKNLPGIRFADKEPVYLGIQKGREVVDACPADQEPVIFRPTFKIGRQSNGAPNFLGPFAQGVPGERFFYLSWGVRHPDQRFEMFRRAKVHLNHLPWRSIETALSRNRPIQVVLDMTDGKGGPRCASLRAGSAEWKI